MSVSIFIKSWLQDLNWLEYCLRFLERNWKEPRSEVVLMLDRDCEDKFSFSSGYQLPLRRTYTDPWPDGYNHAMYSKACADLYCMGDQILLLDSDQMLLEECDASVFLDELPVIPWISYQEHLAIYPDSPWQKVTEKVLKVPAEKHYMPVMPILYWASTLHDMRRHITEIHGADCFESVVYSGEPFSPLNFNFHPHSFVDYDCLGLYATMFESDRYVFRHASELGRNPFKQFHSWTEFNEHTPEILDKLLGEPVSR